MNLADPMLFWTKAAAIGQIVGAIATAIAVIVSLWIVVTERRERFRFRVRLMTVVQQGNEPYDVVSFEITNIGLNAVRVQSFGWRTGWWRWRPDWAQYRWAVQMPDVNQPGSSTPFDLEAGRSDSMLIQLNLFVKERPADQDLFRPRRVPFIGLKHPPIYGLIHTSRGMKKLVKIDKNIRDAMIKRFYTTT